MGEVLPIVFAIAGGACLLLVLLAAWQSVRALMADATGVPSDGDAPRSEAGRRVLLHEKDSLLAAIRELRFEHELGKVSDADLAQLERRYRGRAREVLRLLDEELGPHREAAQALIERARGEAAGGGASASTSAASPPASEAPRSDDRPACGGCGTRNDADARFCKKCGRPLGTEAAP